MAQRKVDPSRAPFLFLIPLIGLALAAAAISLPFAQAEEAGAAAIMAAGGGVEVARHESRRMKCRRFLFSFGRCARAMTKLRRQEPTREAAPAQRPARPATRRSNETVVARKAGPPSNFRTLCVRSCDGYYFPISNATTRSRFKTDEAVCKAMNGGAPAELYVHPVDGGIADAVSLEQKPYRSQPFAFAFHLTFRPACQATLHAGLANLAQIAMAKVAAKEAKKSKRDSAAKALLPAPIPIPRVDGGEDPETVANRAGDVSPAAETDKLAVMREVRRVGPPYYYSEPLQLTVPVPAARRSLVGPANAEAAQTAEPPS